MGTCVNAQNEESSLYAKCVKDMGRIIQQRGLNPIYHYKVIYQFTKLCQEEKAALKVLHGYTNSVISKRRAQLEAVAKSTQKTEDDIGQKKRTAFLDMLLQASINGVPLTDKEIREEVDTFMFEGHDTTAAGICYTLFNLANHPEVQQRAFEELKDIFGDDTERECSYQDLQEMKYLEMVVKETLRLYPSVPLYARMIKDDVTYSKSTPTHKNRIWKNLNQWIYRWYGPTQRYDYWNLRLWYPKRPRLLPESGKIWPGAFRTRKLRRKTTLRLHSIQCRP